MQPAPFDRWSLWRILTGGANDTPLANLKPALLLVSGTSDSGSTTTMVDAARTESDIDYFKGMIMTVTGAGSALNLGVSREITGFDPATDTLKFGTAWPAALTVETYDITVPKRGEAGLAGIITVRPYSEIAIAGFGTDANDETYSAIVYGMMENGPLQKILELNIINGASSFTAPFIDNGRVPSDTYFIADTYAEVDDTNSGSASGVSTGTGTINMFYRLPTLGFKYMMCQLYKKDGVTGVQAMAAGLIWRPIAPRLN